MKECEATMGSAMRIMRELQGYSQSQLSAMANMSESTIAAIEADRVVLEIEQAKTIARVLRCHPGDLVFPGWDIDKESIVPVVENEDSSLVDGATGKVKEATPESLDEIMAKSLTRW